MSQVLDQPLVQLLTKDMDKNVLVYNIASVVMFNNVQKCSEITGLWNLGSKLKHKDKEPGNINSKGHIRNLMQLISPSYKHYKKPMGYLSNNTLIL